MCSLYPGRAQSVSNQSCAFVVVRASDFIKVISVLVKIVIELAERVLKFRVEFGLAQGGA